jgi:hypothetical protein
MANEANQGMQIRHLMGPVRMLAAQKFIDYTNKNGGATMNVNNLDVLEPKKSEAFVVGGEPDQSGKRIETKPVSAEELTTANVLSHAQHIQKSTGFKPTTNIGSWIEPSTKVTELDASAVYPDKKTALLVAGGTAKGGGRNEKAIYNVKTGRNNKNPNYDETQDQR